VNLIGPRSVYDESKRFVEAATMAYSRYYKVDTRIVRIFNTHGAELQLNDGRNLLNPKEMRKLDFTYLSIGRPEVIASEVSRHASATAVA